MPFVVNVYIYVLNDAHCEDVSNDLCFRLGMTSSRTNGRHKIQSTERICLCFVLLLFTLGTGAERRPNVHRERRSFARKKFFSQMHYNKLYKNYNK